MYFDNNFKRNYFGIWIPMVISLPFDLVALFIVPARPNAARIRENNTSCVSMAVFCKTKIIVLKFQGSGIEIFAGCFH